MDRELPTASLSRPASRCDLATKGSPAVNGPWAINLPAESIATLAQLRRMPGIAICQTPDGLWLRGQDADDELDHRLQLLKGGIRFAVLDDGQLVPQAKRVPLGYLPGGPWHPLTDWLQGTLPPAEWAKTPFAPVPLSFVPTTVVREPELLLTRLATWREYLRTAPRWRIERWTFAARGDGMVLICGIPLPPIPGVHWVVEEGVAMIAGATWSPALDGRSLRQSLGLADGEMALFHDVDRWDRIPAESWVRASRSAAAATSFAEAAS
jgi:hypothetical protein